MQGNFVTVTRDRRLYYRGPLDMAPDNSVAVVTKFNRQLRQLEKMSQVKGK